MKDRDKILQHVTVLLTDALLKFNLLHVKVNSPVVMNFNSILEDFDGKILGILIFFNKFRFLNC